MWGGGVQPGPDLARSFGPSEGELVVGVEQRAEIRRMHRVERSIREIHRRAGRHRETIGRALASDRPPVNRGPPAGSKLDRARARSRTSRGPTRDPLNAPRELVEELGYGSGIAIFDGFVRELRPRLLAPAHLTVSRNCLNVAVSRA